MGKRAANNARKAASTAVLLSALTTSWPWLGDAVGGPVTHGQKPKVVQSDRTARSPRSHPLTYRQVERTFHTMVSLIDPTPVPSFARVADAARAAHLAGARAGIDTAAAEAALTSLCDRLLEASIGEAHKQASTSVAVDWTDHASWSRPAPATPRGPPPTPTPRGDIGPPTPPGPGPRCSSATTPRPSPWSPTSTGRPPPSSSGASPYAPSLDPAATMVGVLTRMATAGIGLGDVLADAGYAYRAPTTWAQPLRALRALVAMPTGRSWVLS